MVFLEDDNNLKKEHSKGVILTLRLLSLICFILSVYSWFRAYDLEIGKNIGINFNFESYVLVLNSIGIIIMLFKDNWLKVDKIVVGLNVLSSLAFCGLFSYFFISFALS